MTIIDWGRPSPVGGTIHWCGALDYGNTQHACISCSQFWMWCDQVSQAPAAVILPTVLDYNLELGTNSFYPKLSQYFIMPKKKK